MGIPPSIVSEDLDSLRRQWYVLAKQDPDEARGEELARSLRTEQWLLNESEPSRKRESKTIQIKKDGEVTIIRQEKEYSRPQIAGTVLKCIALRARSARLPRPSRACPTGI